MATPNLKRTALSAILLAGLAACAGGDGPSVYSQLSPAEKAQFMLGVMKINNDNMNASFGAIQNALTNEGHNLATIARPPAQIYLNCGIYGCL